jgi:hypothetical protein
MSLALSFQHRMHGQADVHASLPMPIVYEDVPQLPTRWEYRVLTIDAREEALPDAPALNEMGEEGWLLISVVEQRHQSGGARVHFYFVRQKTQA